MGRGLGLHNKSIEELKEAKRERDLEHYANNRKSIQKQNYERSKTALIINCACGGHYKDISKNKSSHLLTPKHSLWQEEQDCGIYELLMSKYTDCITIEDARNKLIMLYEKNCKYKAIDREVSLPKLIRALKQLPNATPPPPPTPPPTPPPPPTPTPPPPKKVKIKIKKLKLKVKESN